MGGVVRVGWRITSEVRWDQSHLIPLSSHQAPKNYFAAQGSTVQHSPVHEVQCNTVHWSVLQWKADQERWCESVSVAQWWAALRLTAVRVWVWPSGQLWEYECGPVGISLFDSSPAVMGGGRLLRLDSRRNTTAWTVIEIQVIEVLWFLVVMGFSCEGCDPTGDLWLYTVFYWAFFTAYTAANTGVFLPSLIQEPRVRHPAV